MAQCFLARRACHHEVARWPQWRPSLGTLTQFALQPVHSVHDRSSDIGWRRFSSCSEPGSHSGARSLRARRADREGGRIHVFIQSSRSDSASPMRRAGGQRATHGQTLHGAVADDQLKIRRGPNSRSRCRSFTKKLAGAGLAARSRSTPAWPASERGGDSSGSASGTRRFLQASQRALDHAGIAARGWSSRGSLPRLAQCVQARLRAVASGLPMALTHHRDASAASHVPKPHALTVVRQKQDAKRAGVSAESIRWWAAKVRAPTADIWRWRKHARNRAMPSASCAGPRLKPACQRANAAAQVRDPPKSYGASALPRRHTDAGTGLGRPASGCSGCSPAMPASTPK